MGDDTRDILDFSRHRYFFRCCPMTLTRKRKKRKGSRDSRQQKNKLINTSSEKKRKKPGNLFDYGYYHIKNRTHHHSRTHSFTLSHLQLTTVSTYTDAPPAEEDKYFDKLSPILLTFITSLYVKLILICRLEHDPCRNSSRSASKLQLEIVSGVTSRSTSVSVIPCR